MNELERGVMLLCCNFLSQEGIRPLTVPQFRELGRRVQSRRLGREDALRQLEQRDIEDLGYDPMQSRRIFELISREKDLGRYLLGAKRLGLEAVTRVSSQYPARLRQTLGGGCPAVLFFAGNLKLLQTKMISLVGSRKIRHNNAKFAEKVGILAAKEGYTLVSGGAEGADTIAQEACLDAGGAVITVVPDQMTRHLKELTGTGQVLLLSEESYDAPFTPARAYGRNRVIHCLGEKTFVAQTADQVGGTWSGTLQNLKHHWSDVFIYDDQTPGAKGLIGWGATGIQRVDSIQTLETEQTALF